MVEIHIRRPAQRDLGNLHTFFQLVIEDTFEKEGIAHLVEDLEKEIRSKKEHLEADLFSNGEKRYFLLAIDAEKIVGTIEYGPSGELLSRCTNGELAGMGEIGTVFVHPDFQRQGIGNLLFQTMLTTLHRRGINEFCLDSGYRTAQKIWTKKFGEPDYLVKDLWGNGFHHMVWRRKVKGLGETDTFPYFNK